MVLQIERIRLIAIILFTDEQQTRLSSEKTVFIFVYHTRAAQSLYPNYIYIYFHIKFLRVIKTRTKTAESWAGREEWSTQTIFKTMRDKLSR